MKILFGSKDVRGKATRKTYDIIQTVIYRPFIGRFI